MGASLGDATREAGSALREEPGTGERPLRRGAVARGGVRASERGSAEQGRGESRGPGGAGVVGGVGGAADEGFGVGRGVVEHARVVGVGELLQGRVQQRARRFEPARLAGRLVQREEPVGEAAVVVQHPSGRSDRAVAGCAPQPAVDQVPLQQQLRCLRRRVDPARFVEHLGRLGQRGDRHAVPGGDDLVVLVRLRALVAGFAKPLAHSPPTGRVVGVVLELQRRRAVLEGARLGDLEQLHRPFSVDRAEDLPQLVRRPHVGQPFGPFGVGVQRSREAAFRRPQVVQQELGRRAGHPLAERVAEPGEVHVRPEQQGVVVQHLLEVGHHPRGVDAVAREATRQLVVDAAAGHRRAGGFGEFQRGVTVLRHADPLVVAQQELQHHRRRELRRTAESAVDRVEFRVQPGNRTGQHIFVQNGLRERGALRGQLLHHPRGGLPNLLAATAPRLRHGVQQLTERRHAGHRLRRVVGAAVEGFAVGGEEAGHRPAALPGHRLGGFHVDGVDVRPLLAVHLDVHEVLVHHPRDFRVLERFVHHHVAPVAGRVADGQQHRHVPPPRLGEHLGRPGPPVDRVVGVLEQVGTGRVRKPVRHAPSLPLRPTRRTQPRWTIRDRSVLTKRVTNSLISANNYDCSGARRPARPAGRRWLATSLTSGACE